MKKKILVSLPMCLAIPSAFSATVEGDEEKWLSIVPKYFEPAANDGRGGLGFSYKLDKTLTTPVARQDLSQQAYHVVNFDLKAEGNVAFNRDVNPADFLKTGLEINYVYQYSSVPKLGGPGSKCDPADPKTVDECRREARLSRSGGAIAILAGFIGSLESDQQFERRNGTYGAHITTVYRPAPGSLLNQLNVLDWPFRLVRKLSAHPLGFDASPDAFPKVRLAAERIKPKNDRDRMAALGKTEDYDRINVEVAMTSPVGLIQGKQVKFEWSWRYFRELNPENSITAVGLDRFRYSAATLRHDAGWQVTYATGNLPLDRQKDKVWELGYRLKFE